MSCNINYSENYDEPQTEPLFTEKFTFYLKQLFVVTHLWGVSLSFVTSPGADFQNKVFQHALYEKQKNTVLITHFVRFAQYGIFQKLLCTYAQSFLFLFSFLFRGFILFRFILYSLWLMCHINNFKGLVHSLCTIQTTNWIPCQCTVIHSLYVVITNLYDYNDTIHRNKWAIWGIVIPGRSADQHLLCRGSEPRTEVWSLEEGVRNVAGLNRLKCELGQC